MHPCSASDVLLLEVLRQLESLRKSAERQNGAIVTAYRLPLSKISIIPLAICGVWFCFEQYRSVNIRIHLITFLTGLQHVSAISNDRKPWFERASC